jgi:hypothetical protein
MSRWHPWRHLRDTYPHVHVDTRKVLPPGVEGEWDGECAIVLHCELTQAERRCTLTHEIIHMERGWRPCSRLEAQLEEAIVVELTARRLITLDDLIDAVRWAPDHPDHRDLWVDCGVLRDRVRTLTDVERAQIAAAVGG